jgi:hypothetical protein
MGHLIDQLGACTYDRAIADHDPHDVGWRVVHDHVHEPVELRSGATEVPIIDGHGGRALGLLRHVETGESGDVHIVADLFGSLPAGDHAGRLFLSAEGAVQGGVLELRAIAVTSNPAMTLRPIQVISGTPAGLADATVLHAPQPQPRPAHRGAADACHGRRP